MKRFVNQLSLWTLTMFVVLTGGGARAETGSEEKAPQVKALETLAGDYTLTSRFWRSPGAEPEVTKLPAHRSLVVDGKVLRVDVGPDETGFRGTGLLGYDEGKQRFWYVWTDTTTTGRSLLEGRLDSRGRGTLEGETPTPIGYVPLRVEIRRDGTVEVHDYFGVAEDGTSYQWLELRYKRVE